MRRILYSFFLTFALANTALQADYDQIDLTNTELPSGNSDNGLGILQGGSGMFAIEANSDHIRPAKFKKKDIKHEEVSFTGFDIDASMVFYYDKENHEAVNVEVGYNRTNIHWKENPYFDQNIFNTATVSVNAQTSRMCNWLWKGKIAFNVDTDHFDIQEYSTWDLFGWGRYNLNECWGLHAGIIVLTGMKIDHVYPIIGFDWIISEKWKLNAVFPVNMSVVYVIDEFWSLDVTARAIETRNRVGKRENLSKALVQYFNKGIEFGVNYDIGDSIQANVHVGQMLGGRLKIANKQNDRPHHKRFNSSPYVGAEILVRY